MPKSRSYTDHEIRLAVDGEYYSLIHEVWGDVKAPFQGGFKAIRREKPHGHFHALLSQIGLAKKKEGGSKESSKLTSLTASSAAGNEKRDLFDVIGGEDGHQVPDSDTCSPPYGIICQQIMGCLIEELSSDDLEKTIKKIEHIGGSANNCDTVQEEEVLPTQKDGKKNNSKKKKKKPQTRQLSTEELEKKKWVVSILKYLVSDAKLSVKNLAINRMRVASGHQDPYDVDPELIIIPIYTLKDAKDWTPGREYEIAIISASTDVYAQMVGARPMSDKHDRTVGEASPEELQKATDLLADFVKAHAEIASGNREGGIVSPLDFFAKNDPKREKLESLRDSLENGEVQVPFLKAQVDAKVLKVKLENKYDYTVPDPMLVAMKAAINWYYIVSKGTKMLPACKPPVDPEKALIEQMNDELHDEVLQEYLRPSSLEDLAKGLHQWPPSTP